MPSNYSEIDRERVRLTLGDIGTATSNLIEWNCNVSSSEDYYTTQQGAQLLAANCTLITAIGEGVNRCNRIMPGFLSDNFPNIPWHAIIGMRNHIAHGYFELDADMVFEAVKTDIPSLKLVICEAVAILTD